MELTLIRHAEPERGSVGPARADPGLGPRGRAQAHALAAAIAATHYDALYSSPLLRARETAAAIEKASGLKAVVDEDLAEYDRDAPEYLHFEDLQAAGDPRVAQCLAGDLSPWGTDAASFRRRVGEAFDRIIGENSGRKVVVVSHGGVANAYLGGLIGVQRLFFFHPEYTGLSRVRASSRGTRNLISLNEAAHLAHIAELE